MEKFNWTKALGFGVLIWIIMFALVSLLGGIGVYDAIFSKIIVVVVAAIVSYLFATNIKSLSFSQAFSYGLLWVALGIGLDLLFSVRFSSSVSGAWEYWLSYALILFAPMIHATPKMEKSQSKVSDVSHAH